MGSPGAIVMGFFGAVFFIGGLGPAIGWRSPLFLLPCAIVAYIAVSVFTLSRMGSASLRTTRAGKIILWSTVGEGIGIFIAVNLCVNLASTALIIPAIALVVGLHFLPMAYAIPFRTFYGLAAALLVAAACGFLLRQPTGSAVTGIAAACALWCASFMALRRERLALTNDSVR